MNSRALHIRFSASDKESSPSKPMPDPITEAVKHATESQASLSDWWTILYAFVFGGAASAFATWRAGYEKPDFRDICSSLFFSGTIAAGVICILISYKLPFYTNIGISIFAGIGGDMIAKMALRGMEDWLRRFFGYDAKQNSSKRRGR